jgi:hypothetical protein
MATGGLEREIGELAIGEWKKAVEATIGGGPKSLDGGGSSGNSLMLYSIIVFYCFLHKYLNLAGRFRLPARVPQVQVEISRAGFEELRSTL